MSIPYLEEYFKKLDDLFPDLDALANTTNERTAARLSIDLMKLEALDSFITDHCYDDDIKEAFAQFRTIALADIKAYINSL